jgi:hypothetical protein
MGQYTPARGPLLRSTVLLIFYHIFPSTVQVLHVVSWEVGSFFLFRSFCIFVYIVSSLEA